MAFLISAVAELMKAPNGLWEWLILKVFSFISNYGWRIVFFTLCLKILLVPLDIYQRFKMRKNQKISERIKPQIEALQQQYANDQKTLSQKQMALQKSEGFSYFSSCLPMIVTLVVFFYLFSGLNNISQYKNLQQYVELYDAYTVVEQDMRESVTIEDSLNMNYNSVVKEIEDIYSKRPNADDYKLKEWDAAKGGEEKYNAALAAWTEEMPNEADYKTDGVWNEGGEEKYNAALTAWEEKKPKVSDYQKVGDWDEAKGGEEGYNAAVNAWQSEYSARESALVEERAKLESEYIAPAAEAAVVKRYNEVKESFLWVQNIWAPDVPWRKAILGSKNFETNIANYKKYDIAVKKLKIDKSKLSSVEFDAMIRSYDKVTGALVNDKNVNKVNGFLILPILSVGLSFLSQFITSRLQKKSGQVTDQTAAGSMKAMMVFMPLMMGFFALQYTAMFTLYIVMNSATTIIINVITTLAMDGKDKKDDKDKTTKVQKYGRPDPSEL